MDLAAIIVFVARAAVQVETDYELKINDHWGRQSTRQKQPT